MDQKKPSRQVVRFTLAAVHSAQNNIRHHLDNLVKEDRPIKNDKERNQFFFELTYSCLGLAAEPVKFHYRNNEMLKLDNLEGFIRDLTYYDDKIVSSEFLYKHNSSFLPKPIDIGELWDHIRRQLFKFFPKAIHMATSISKEKEESGKSKGFQV